MRTHAKAFVLLVALLCLAVSGCTLLKASAAPDAGFLPEPTLLSDYNTRGPFHASWMIDAKRYEHLRKNYKTIAVKHISTSFVEAQLQEESLSERLRTIRTEELQEVARYFRNKLVMVFNMYEGHPLKVTQDEKEASLILEIALVEVRPTNPFINTAGTVAGAFVPGGGLIKIAGKGSVAMEGYIRDAKTGELLEQFKDRESDKAAPFTIKDFQEYAHVRVALDDWSMQLAELLATPLDQKVEDSLPFSLNPF